MSNVINFKEYKEKKDRNELAQRVADIIAMQCNDEGELVEPGALWWDPDVPDLKVPPHLVLVDDPDDCA